MSVMAIKSRPTRLLQFFLGVVIIATIGVFGVKLYRLHDHAHIRYDPRQEILWLTPTTSDPKRKSPIISNKRWRHNYSDIERVLWEAQALGTKPSAPLELLERINKLLPENLAPDELLRLRSLVEKSVLSDNAQTFARWIVSYYHYRNTDRQLTLAINQAPDDQRVALIESYLINLNTAQEKLFGNHASTLFKQENSQTRYFYQRRLVRLDDSLDEQQKKTALAALKQDYQAKLQYFRPD